MKKEVSDKTIVVLVAIAFVVAISGSVLVFQNLDYSGNLDDSVSDTGNLQSSTTGYVVVEVIDEEVDTDEEAS